MGRGIDDPGLKHRSTTQSKASKLTNGNLVTKSSSVLSKEHYEIVAEPGEPYELPLQTIPGLVSHFLSWTLWGYYLWQRYLICKTSSNLGEWALLLCEIAPVLSDLQSAFELTLSLVPSKATTLKRPKLRLQGPKAPTVHVFITICGEDLDVIMDTVAAAATQDYPRDCYQVFVLDDKASTLVQDEIFRFNQNRAADSWTKPVVYLAREKLPGHPHFYKAGNLKFGIETTAKEYGDSPYFAALDCDCIPERGWLSRTVPHIIQDDEIAMVGPPQLAYNIPEDDALSQDSNIFAHVLEPVHDRFGACQCSGSGYIMRRSALDSIGGWPLVNVGEDIVCSYLLTGQGWKIAFIPDQLQFGLAPGSFEAYITQRMRWTDGSLLVAKKFRFFLPFLTRGENRSIMQRLFAMLHAVKTYVYVLSFFAMILIPICLLFMSTPMATTVPRGYISYIYLPLWLSLKASTYFNYGHLGMKNISNMSKNRRWVTPFNVFRIFDSLFTSAEKMEFVVTGSFVSKANERSTTHRQPLPRRLMSKPMYMYMGYLAFASIALVTWMTSKNTSWSVHNKAKLYMHTGVVLQLLDIMWAAVVPIRYMWQPPTMPERKQLLTRDEFGVDRPSQEGWVKREGPLVSTKDIIQLGIIVALDWL